MKKHKEEKEPLKTHQLMVKEWMKEPEFKAAYDALENEYQCWRKILQASRFNVMKGRKHY